MTGLECTVDEEQAKQLEAQLRESRTALVQMVLLFERMLDTDPVKKEKVENANP